MIAESLPDGPLIQLGMSRHDACPHGICSVVENTDILYGKTNIDGISLTLCH